MGNKPREGLRVKQLVSNVLELRDLLLTCWPGFWAVLPSTAHPSRRMSHNPGSYVGFVWRGTRRISLSLLFFSPLIYLSAWFSVLIPALVLNREQKTLEISSPKWCQAWQCVPTLRDYFFCSPMERTRKGTSKPHLRLGPVMYYACPLVDVKGWLKSTLRGAFGLVLSVLFMTGR